MDNLSLIHCVFICSLGIHSKLNLGFKLELCGAACNMGLYNLDVLGDQGRPVNSLPDGYLGRFRGEY